MAGEIEKVVRALEGADVRYLVVGGVAVVLHGRLRATADLDLVIQLESDNVRRAVGALASLGYVPRARSMPALEVDVFVAEPFDFDQVHRRALRVPLASGVTASVVSLQDLIALKRAAGRPLDRDDVEALEALDRDDNSDEDPHGN